MTDDKRIAIGGTMKAVGDEGIVEGYAVSFTSPERRDLHGQYFTKNTDFHREINEIVGIPILYHHGFDKRIKRKILGYVTKAAVDERGVWIQAQLDMHKEYVQDVFEVAKRGALAWSSGADPLEVRASNEGHLDDWPFVEFSETPTPAEPEGTPIRAKSGTVISAKSYQELLKGDTGHEEQDDRLTADIQTDSPSTSSTPHKGMTMDEMTARLDKLEGMLAQILTAVTDDMNADATEGETALAAMNTLPEDDKAAMLQEDDPEKQKAAIQKAIQVGMTAIHAKRNEANRAPIKNALTAAKQQMAASPQKSFTDQKGLPMQQTQVTVQEERRYAEMSASDMMLAVQMRLAAMKGLAYDPRFLFGKQTESFMRTMVAKTHAYINKGGLKDEHAGAMKAAMPWKVNELDASNIVTQGYEWVAEEWSTDLWLRDRAPTWFDQWAKMGMMIRTPKPGFSTVHFPLEGNDAQVFAPPQANSLDATGKPETTAAFTPFTTGDVEMTPSELVLATSYTIIFEEDSVIDLAPQVNRSIEEKFKETRDQLIINGDSTRTASTNINYIDGTPAAGIRSPWYTAFDGWRKHALITYPTQSRFGGVLDFGDFKATINLLPYVLRSRFNRIAVIITPDVESWAVDFPQLLTAQVRPVGYTAETGILPKISGVFPFTSDYMPATGVAGKEYRETANLALNVYGTILAVYVPYWGFGYKRQVTVDVQHNIYSGTMDYVARARMGLVARGANAAAITYGLSQS